MNKPVVAMIVLVAIVPLYCGATRMLASSAQQKETELLDKMQEQSKGLIKIVSRKTDTHFFSSSEDIQFELDHPFFNAILKKDANDKPVTQFVIHNDIAYGPLPNFTSVGAARIETSLVLTEDQQKILIEALGTDKPLRFFTTLGYFGRTHFEVQSPRLELHAKDVAGSVWKGGKVRFVFSTDLDGVKFSGSSPGLVINGKDGSQWLVDNITARGAIRRKFDLLFTGEEMFGIGSFAYTNPKSTNSNGSAKDLVYGFRSTADKQFMNVNVIAESGPIVVQNAKVKATHFDFGFSHLDLKSLASLYNSYQQIQMQTWKALDKSSTSQPNPADQKAEPTGTEAGTMDGIEADRIKQQIGKDVVALLQHSPVFSLDHVGFSTSDGALKITGMATLDGVVEEDILPELQYQALISKVYATADIGIDQSLIDHWPIPGTTDQLKQQLFALESQGLIVRKGKRLESHLEYKEGKLTANGKPLS